MLAVAFAAVADVIVGFLKSMWLLAEGLRRVTVRQKTGWGG
jgi:hypothetical protein